ncbi:MAG: branched-chain amino acid ABC transporter substrate-binding protein [Actinomycetota bacterium]|jgi:branched-chain amino acid transport system substrate-binding protein|nr:branched-chain amino acid ABC transporter substrate-binding protein [Actinomycetota bacterium]
MAANSSGVTRKAFLRGLGAAGAGGLIVGAAGGYAGGAASSSSSSSSGKSSGSKSPIVLGSGVPVTGLYSGDGQMMQRGQRLAIDEINAAGGVLGRKLELSVLDTQTQQPDVMKSVFQKFVSDGVAAVFAPFCTYSSVEFPIVAQAGMPTFHVNTWHGNVDFVKQHGITNIFQGDPSETWYGPGFVVLVEELIKTKKWTPSSKTMAIVTSNDPYSLNIANTFNAEMTKLGWKATMFQQFTAPQADWSAVLVNIRNNPPGIVFFSDYAASDEAAFMKQFRQSPTKSLVYQQYAPSIPQYLQLAGSAADGVLWSTVVGILQNDPIADPFQAAFTKQFGTGPGFSNAGDQYDLVHIWANAAAEAGDPYDFKSINEIVKNTVYRGVCGTYRFPDDYLTCYPYPDYTKDPSLGMPHLTFQIQNGKQVLVSPDPYSTGSFQLPSWL